MQVYVVCYALSDYGTQKLIRDDFLVTWLILGHVTNCCKRPVLFLTQQRHVAIREHRPMARRTDMNTHSGREFTTAATLVTSWLGLSTVSARPTNSGVDPCQRVKVLLIDTYKLFLSKAIQCICGYMLPRLGCLVPRKRGR